MVAPSPNRGASRLGSRPDPRLSPELAGRIVGLSGSERDRAIPCLRDSFVGVYRWHAKRTLRDVERVRAISDARGDIVAVAMTELLVPEAGYVYYIAVSQKERRQGFAGLLLDEAMDDFRERGARVVYAAVVAENEPSRRLFRSRGFREVDRRESGYREGGLGAWGLRSRMRIVWGEVLLGVELRSLSRPPQA